MRVEEINLSDINKGERFRKDYKDIPKLMASIEEKGLIQPIAVWENNGSYLLLAGGRRLQAFEHLERSSIPCRIYDRELSTLEIRAIELAENIDREDFEYHEKIRLEEEIHELMIAVKGKKISTAPGAEGHSLADTARMLNKAPATLTRDMQIAQAMNDFPELQWDKMKSKQDAFKVVKKIQTAVTNMECAKVVEAELGTGEVKKKKIYNSYIVGDFFEYSKELPDNYYHFVEVDPPYAIDLQKQKKDYSYSGYNEIEVSEYENFINKTFKICYNKMAPNSWGVFWFGPDPWFNFIGNALRKAGFQTTGLVGLWVKGESSEGLVESAGGQTNMPNQRLANAYEMFYYAWKGNPCLASPGRSNVYGYRPVPPSRKTHPTERPIELIDSILSTFVPPGARVLVPFAGSGTTLISAFKRQMVPIGFDLTQSYKDSFVVRVSQEDI